MTRVLTTSDPHIAHSVVALDRGFSCTRDHDDFFAQQWVENVTKKDSVWILGDLASSNPKPALELLAKLPGIKHLVAGNHDPVHPLYPDAHRQFRKYLDVFASVQMAASRRIGDRNVVLSHFPYGSQYSYFKPGPEWRETDAPGYFANQDGQIRGRFGRVLKPWLAGFGYEYVAVSDGCKGTKNRTVHSLVCAAFHGQKPTSGHQVGHNDGNPRNNRAQNLRWATRKENMADRVVHGTDKHPSYSRPGELNPNAKLSGPEVSFIRESLGSVAETAEQFGVSTNTVHAIRNGTTWNNTVPKTSGDGIDRDDRYNQWRLRDEGLWLLHGHVHKAWKVQGRQVNVGFDAWQRPVSFDELGQFIDAFETSNLIGTR